jgi:hypothetical protein
MFHLEVIRRAANASSPVISTNSVWLVAFFSDRSV